MEIIRLNRSRKREAAALFARAFFDYPQFIYYFPNAGWRKRHLVGFMESWISYALHYGRVDATPELSGLACWLPPGKTRISNWGMLLTGLGPWFFRTGWRSLARMSQYEGEAEKIQLALAPGPHWYLWGLAVDPACQGHGIGRQLMQPVLEQADREGLPCFLETHKAANVAFYEKSGFRVVHSQEGEGVALPFWCMLRIPAPG